MAEQTPSKPTSLDHLKQAFNKVKSLFGEFASNGVVQGYPVPTSPPRTPTPAAYTSLSPFPEPATPPGWCAGTPGGQHDHEASGSDHTSNHTSEYFDAMDPSQFENLLQFQISVTYDRFDDARLRNRKQYGSEQGYEHAQQGIEHPQYGFSIGSQLSQFGSEHPHFGTEHYQNGFEHLQQEFEFERPHPGLEEQLAGSFGNILLNTPTASHASHPHPWDDILNPVTPVSVRHHHDPPAQEYYHSGEYGGMSVRTGETGDSRESLMDTAGTSTTSPYILAPVAEEKPSILSHARGDEVVFASARMGRGMRVLGKAFCYTLRLGRVFCCTSRVRKSGEYSHPDSPRWTDSGKWRARAKRLPHGMDSKRRIQPGDATFLSAPGQMASARHGSLWGRALIPRYGASPFRRYSPQDPQSVNAVR